MGPGGSCVSIAATVACKERREAGVSLLNYMHTINQTDNMAKASLSDRLQDVLACESHGHQLSSLSFLQLLATRQLSKGKP